MESLTKIATNAKQASKVLRAASSATKNDTLLAITNLIDNSRAAIVAANKKDIQSGKENNLNKALLDRLLLDNKRIDSIITSLKQIIALADPIGEISHLNYRPSGIQVGKMRVALGVVGIIYEARPNVTIDAAALCIKSGNAAILRGGKEALNSNLALFDCVKSGLIKMGLDKNCAQFINSTERSIVNQMTQATGLIDVIIPRGGKGLIEAVSKSARVPIIKHLDGVCHTYIDKFADIDKAVSIAINAKTRRYGVCNATETLLVHKDTADKVMPKLIKQYKQKGVELRGCEKTRAFANHISPATDKDWYTEYLAPILSVRIVVGIDEAIAHIEQYGSRHTDSIITQNINRAKLFLSQVDSSSVMVNASTGFADGFEYGLGAEIGISTDKIHARGPVGLEGLTSQKYIVLGDGQTRP